MKGLKQTMKHTRRIIAILLALVMVGSFSSVVALAYDAVPQMKTDMYLQFGDSSSTGYAMMSKEEMEAYPVMDFFLKTTNDKRIEGSYPDIIAHYADIPDGSSRFHKFAREGLSTDNVAEIVMPDYYNTETDRQKAASDLAWSVFTEDRTTGKKETLSKLQKDYKKCVANSKGKRVLVTLNIGANDILSGPVVDILCGAIDAVKGNISYEKEVYDLLMSFVDSFGEGNMKDAGTILVQLAAVAGYSPEALARAVEDEIKAIPAFQEKWDKITSKIYDDFTNAGANLTFVVVGFYNATRDLKLIEADPYHIGRNMGAFSALFQQYVAEQSPNKDKYLYAYIRDVDLSPWPNMVDWPLRGTSFVKDFMYSSHPTAKGHQMIADRVKNVILTGKSDELGSFLYEALN